MSHKWNFAADLALNSNLKIKVPVLDESIQWTPEMLKKLESYNEFTEEPCDAKTYWDNNLALHEQLHEANARQNEIIDRDIMLFLENHVRESQDRLQTTPWSDVLNQQIEQLRLQDWEWHVNNTAWTD